MLEIKNLTKYYYPKKGSKVLVLDKLSFYLKDKGFVFLVGKSGSGKSTLLNLIAGLDSFDSGEITINNISTINFNNRQYDYYRNSFIGFIFQEYNLIEEYTVYQNIVLALKLQSDFKDIKEKVSQVLETVLLKGYENRKISELSGGQKQRIAIARALVKDPEIILADEITGALDSETGEELFNILKEISKTKLVIAVTHEKEYAYRHADQIIELVDGNIVLNVSKEEYTLVTPKKEIIDEQLISKALNVLDKEDKELFTNLVEESNYVYEGFKHVDENQLFESSHNLSLKKSKLPIISALNLGFIGLKKKKYRLLLIIFLSFLMMSLFTISHGLSSYSEKNSNIQYLYDQGISHIKISNRYEKNVAGDIHSVPYGMSSELKEKLLTYSNSLTEYYLNKYTGNIEFSLDQLGRLNKNKYYYTRKIYNLIKVSDITEQMGLSFLTADSRYPDAKNEIVITDYIADSYLYYGYESEEIETVDELIDKTIEIDGCEMRIVGVVSTEVNMKNYEYIKNENSDTPKQFEIMDVVSSSTLAGCAFVSDNYEDNFNTLPLRLSSYYLHTIDKIGLATLSIDFSSILEYHDDIDIRESVSSISSLNDNEIILSYSSLPRQLREDTSLILGETVELYYDLSLQHQRKEFVVVGITNDNTHYLYSNIVKEISDFYFSPRSFLIKLSKNLNSDARMYTELTDRLEEMPIEGMNILSLKTPITQLLIENNELLMTVKNVFFYLCFVFAILFSIFLFNYINLSIILKKKDIGILRALGATKMNVFLIFVMEILFILVISLALSSISTVILTNLANVYFYAPIVIINLLNYAFSLLISTALALLITSIPSYYIANKTPIEAINNR